jgi:hypothetical protein
MSLPARGDAMKKRATVLVALTVVLLPVRGPAQSTIPWSAIDMGYAVSASQATVVKSAVGQAFVGVMRGTQTIVESGFLVDTLLRTTVTSVAGPTELPTEYALHQNYPNPFNPSTTIRYALPERSFVTLVLYNILGQRVVTLAEGEREAGYHEVRFEASGFASGVYLYRIQVHRLDSAIGQDSRSGAGDFVQTRRLVLLR